MRLFIQPTGSYLYLCQLIINSYDFFISVAVMGLNRIWVLSCSQGSAERQGELHLDEFVSLVGLDVDEVGLLGAGDLDGAEVWDSGVGLVGGSVKEVDVGLSPGLVLLLTSGHGVGGLIELEHGGLVWDSGVGSVGGSVEVVNVGLS